MGKKDESSSGSSSGSESECDGKGENMGKKGGLGGLFEAYASFREGEGQNGQGSQSGEESEQDVEKEEPVKTNSKKQKNGKEKNKKKKKKDKKKDKKAAKKVKTELKKAQLEIARNELCRIRDEKRRKNWPPRYPDDTATEVIVSAIAADRKWSSGQVMADMRSLLHNRLYTAGDLRMVSEESWRVIELLPFVKDMLRRAIDERIDVPDSGESSCSSSSDSETSDAESMESSGEPLVEEPREPEPEPTDLTGTFFKYMSVPTSDMGASGTSTTNDTRAKSKSKSKSGSGSTPRIRSSTSASRMVVRNDLDGKLYEVDRYCPHKGVDMKGDRVQGGALVCHKHNWRFDLARGGVCSNKGKGRSINAVCLANDPNLQW